MQNAEQFWDNAAQKYAKSPIANMDSYNYTLERTRSYLAPGDNILEVGCGTGSTALLLAGQVRQITASDLSENMVTIGAQKAADQGISNVKFVNAGIFDRALENETSENGLYDGVLAFNLLHLIEDAPGAIARINAMLKPGGIFISKTVCVAGSGLSLKFQLIRMILPLMQWVGKAPYVNFMQIEELEEIISAQGFKIIETGNYPASPPNRYIVARKV